ILLQSPQGACRFQSLLDGVEIGEESVNLFGLQREFRHFHRSMAGQNAFSQGLRQVVDIDLLAELAEYRSLFHRAWPRARDRMALRATARGDLAAFLDEVVASAGL